MECTSAAFSCRFGDRTLSTNRAQKSGLVKNETRPTSISDRWWRPSTLKSVYKSSVIVKLPMVFLLNHSRVDMDIVQAKALHELTCWARYHPNSVESNRAAHRMHKAFAACIVLRPTLEKSAHAMTLLPALVGVLNSDKYSPLTGAGKVN